MPVSEKDNFYVACLQLKMNVAGDVINDSEILYAPDSRILIFYSRLKTTYGMVFPGFFNGRLYASGHQNL